MFSVFGSRKRQAICSAVRGINMAVERANAFTMYYEPFELEEKADGPVISETAEFCMVQG